MKDIQGFTRIFYKFFISLHFSNGFHTGLNEICWSITKNNVNNIITGTNVFDQEQEYSFFIILHTDYADVSKC